MENSKIIEKNKDSVILLRLFIPGENNQRKISIRGTGFIVSNDGKFITSSHVYREIPENERQYFEAQIPGKTEEGITHYDRFDIEILKIDEENDVALMKLKTADERRFTPITEMGNAEQVKEGDEIIMLGYPLATELMAMGFGITMSTTHCIVSAVKRKNVDKSLHFLMVDADINKGSSGSPVFLRKSGEVIGIASGRISFRIQTDPVNQSKFADIPANMGICRPINYIKGLIK
jgi:S1-C subfamily serine protease